MSKRFIALMALVAALALGVAACGDDDDETTAANQEPVATIDTLTGVDTAVTLDANFVQALTDLKVTPGVVGDASLKDGVVSFPITGGNVTQAAKLAGRNRTDFYKLLSRHNLQPDEYKQR